MELKEKIIKEIEMIPEDYLLQIERYLELIKEGGMKKRQIKTLSLKGIYDNINIRKLAYE